MIGRSNSAVAKRDLSRDCWIYLVVHLITLKGLFGRIFS
jgi:hypothetical protein